MQPLAHQRDSLRYLFCRCRRCPSLRLQLTADAGVAQPVLWQDTPATMRALGYHLAPPHLLDTLGSEHAYNLFALPGYLLTGGAHPLYRRLVALDHGVQRRPGRDLLATISTQDNLALLHHLHVLVLADRAIMASDTADNQIANGDHVAKLILHITPPLLPRCRRGCAC
jgi:hypothetical protein